MKKYLGSSGESLPSLMERATKAYEEGYNSLFVSRNGSFHDAQALFYAQKRENGRKVKNPKGWLEKTYEKEVLKDISLIRFSRKF